MRAFRIPLRDDGREIPSTERRKLRSGEGCGVGTCGATLNQVSPGFRSELTTSYPSGDMLRMIRFILPVLVLAACASAAEEGPDQEVFLEAQPTAVSPGETVTLTLSNRTPWPVGYNLCTSSLERESAGAWEPVPEDRMCTMELRMLDPGERSALDLQLPPDLQPATYRYTANIEDRGSMETVSSTHFQVR